MFLQEILTDLCEFFIRFCDRFSIEVHFLRYLYLAIFDARPKTLITNEVIIDCCLLAFIVIPMFIISLRFWTAPVYLNYNLKMNSFATPFALIVCFMGSHTDIILLGLLVCFMNFYVFWYHIDPPSNIY